MKKSIFLFVAVFLFGFFSFGQDVIPDSIHKKKMDSLAKLSGRFMNTNIDSTIAIANRMLKYSEKHHFLRGKGQALATLGAGYNGKGDKGKALVYYKRTLSIFNKLDNEILANRITILISSIFNQTKDFDQALIYAKKAEKYHLKNNDLRNLARVYHVIARIYENTHKDFDDVLHYLNKAEEVSRSFIRDTSNSKTQINLNITELCAILNSKSKIYIKRNKDLTSAISFANRSIRKTKNFNPNAHYFLGYSYLLLGEAYCKKKEFKKALLYNDSALASYKAMNYDLGLLEIYENRKNILVGIGNYKKAFEVVTNLSTFKDSLNNEERKIEFNRMKAEYETDRISEEKERALTRAVFAENKNKENINYLIGTLLIAILLLLSAFFYVKKLKTEKKAALVSIELSKTKNKLQLEKKHNESQLNTLKLQMNPHFIFNALNSIQQYIVKNKKEEASDYLGDFADLIRRYLNYSTKNSISILEEVEALKIYLNLEALRFEDDFNYHISLSSFLDTETIQIPSMMIQPYIENAIRHGLLHKKGKRKLLVSFYKSEQNNTIICVVEDNGIGRKRGFELSQKRYHNHKSFAEKATQERLKLFNTYRDTEVGVEIIDLQEDDQSLGTKVILNLPILS